MPPSGVIATSAAGGNTWPTSSDITRSTAKGSLRDKREPRRHGAFHVHHQRAGFRVKRGLVVPIFENNVTGGHRPLMRPGQFGGQRHTPALVAAD